MLTSVSFSSWSFHPAWQRQHRRSFPFEPAHDDRHTIGLERSHVFAVPPVGAWPPRKVLTKQPEVQPLEMIPAQVSEGVIQVEAVHEGGDTNGGQGVPCGGGNGGGVKNARGPWSTGTARTNPAG